MAQDGSRRFNWAGLPLIATVARLLRRELALQNEYLRLENRILMSKVKGRLRFLLHDRDKCFGGDLEAVVQSAGVESLATPCHAPNANAHCERWIRTAREECLNHLILSGLKSLQRVVHTYRVFHNEHRPHQGIGNRVPRAVRTGAPAPEPVSGPIGAVHCEDGLGGLLKSYRRAA